MLLSQEKRESLSARIHELTGWPVRSQFEYSDHTADPMRLTRGSVLCLEGREFVIKSHMREPRFGLEDQIKYWVLSAIELDTGKQKILKTIFKEEFHVHIGILKIRCFRNPEKESEVLRQTRGDHRFMQGETVFDSRGNNVRVIDFIRGKTLFQEVVNLPLSHEEYYHTVLPSILWNLKGSIEAIQLVHRLGYCHGDIRNDHIIVERGTGAFRWIDFDLSQSVKDFDLWSVGNIVNYVVAKGIITFKNTLRGAEFSDKVRDSITPEDGSAFYEYRIMNLGKVYPYIPKRLNNILLHFTVNPVSFYNSIDQLLLDYNEMLEADFAEHRPVEIDDSIQ